MNEKNTLNDRVEQEKENVVKDLQRQPQLFMSLAENSLTVAESLRDNYFHNTAKFIATVRVSIREAIERGNNRPVLTIQENENVTWDAVQNEVVTFIDAGVGQAQISGQIPILLRVGSYCVRIGERHLAKREQFGYYPVILGDLQGGSKNRRDFIDIVRITAELLGGLSALERNSDLHMLMFHGPLVYLMGGYAGHTPFTEKDIDLFLRQYAPDPNLGEEIKEEFLYQAKLDIYPQIAESFFPELVKKRLFEPLTWIAYLYRKIIQKAAKRNPIPIIAGVVERGKLSEFSRDVLLTRIFRRLIENDKLDYLNQIYGRSDLNSPKAFLDRLSYTDSLLLSMLLQPGQYSEPWLINKYEGLGKGYIVLPDDSRENPVNWMFLKSSKQFGFPPVCGCYIHVSENTEPIRVEVFDALGHNQIKEATRRVQLYSRLLPGYGFPVGLDIVDKYAKVPAWMTDAYSKLIRYHLGVSLQRGEISDTEMRKILVQAIYMTHRDWLFRPKS